MKKVIIIGAGKGQVPFIEKCRKMGCEIHVVSPKGNYPGLGIADFVLHCDVRNKEAICEYAKKNNVDAILTDQMDIGVQTVGYVNEKLGLKGLDYSTAKKFTNKYEMRKAAFEAGILVPPFAQSNDLEDLLCKANGIGFPLIMKPVDSDSSHGVFRVFNENDIKKYFSESQSASSDGFVIIEALLQGHEYVCEAITLNGITTNVVVGHRDYFNIEGSFIPSGTIFSDAVSADSKIENKIKAINSSIIKAFGLKIGITHAEFFVEKSTNKVYLIEIAARGGGVFISSDLVPLATKVDIDELFLRNILGYKTNNKIKIQKGASAYFCFLLPEGVIKSISGVEEAERINGVFKVYTGNISVGEKTAPIKDKASRKGPVLVFANTKNDCYSILSEVKKALDIKVDSSEGERGIIWS